MNVLPRHRKSSPHRIRTYLILYGAALVLPLLALSTYALNRMAEVEQNQIERRVLQVARNLAVGVDQELDRALVTLETLSTSSELRTGDFRGFHQQALLALKPKKAAIVLVDRSYQQLVDTLRDFGTPLPKTADPETAQRVIDTREPQISNVFSGSVSGLPVFNVEVPVLGNNREVRYVLIMSFQASHLSDMLRQVQLSPSWIAGITDRNGIVLARSERAEEFVGRPLPGQLFAQTKAAEGLYKAVNVTGEPILRATARSERAGWYISATVPVSHMQEPRARSFSFAALLLAIALTLGTALAYIFGQLMARPLDEAIRTAEAVGRGESVRITTTSLFEANVLLQTLEKASSDLISRADHAAFLLRELAHRAKNQLAVVKGMALQTARQSENVSAFIAAFDKRIEGLAQSQEVLLKENWRGARLLDLVNAHVELFGARDRVRVAGPSVFLDAAAVQNVGFALHELATNASKHGALSTPDGVVSIHWELTRQGSVHLSWIEQGGPPVVLPTRQGFGRRVIADLVPRSLNGSSQLQFAPEGFRWGLEIPEDHVLSINPTLPSIDSETT